MKSLVRLVLLPAALSLMMLACSDGSSNGQSTPTDPRVEIPFRQDGTLDFLRSDGSAITTIAIEIAESDSARARGLMQRSSLPPNSGMLFIFEREEPRSFWMANTRIGLDMVFVDADSTIVDLQKYVKPMSPQNTVSDAPARYVIEVPAGFADSHGLTETDRVRWQRSEDP